MPMVPCRKKRQRSCRFIKTRSVFIGAAAPRKAAVRGRKREEDLSLPYSTKRQSLLASQVLGPMPRTFRMSSGFSKGPCCSRYSTIRAA